MLAALFNQNQLTKAEALARSFTIRFPKYGYGWKALGAGLYQQRRIEEASVAMQKAVELLPDDAEAHFNLFFSLYEQQRLTEAVACLRKTLELKPNYADAHTNLGLILKKQGQLAEAETSFRRVLEINPNCADAQSNLGSVFWDQGRLTEAEACYRRALEINPDLVEVYSNLGYVLQDLGQLDDAEACYRRVLGIKPDFAKAHGNLGAILKKQGRLIEAETSLRRGLEIDPNCAEDQNNLGSVFWDQGRLIEAEARYRKALEINPDIALVHSNLGNIFLVKGNLIEAEASFRKALKINPNLAEVHSDLLFCLSNSEEAGVAALFAEHCRFGEQFETPLRQFWPPHSNTREPERCLQIGFVSGDLRYHAVANFIEPVLAQLAAYPQLVLHAYYNHGIEDDVTLRLRQYLQHWHSIVGLSDDALAEKIRAEGIDILIDLSGHTARNRLLTFARKPAPVQVSWIGYPGTTGLSAMDYYLADRFLVPPGQLDDQFTEKIARLPAGATYQPDMAAPPVNALPALSNGYITFGSFNRQSKLSQSVISLWSQLLCALPGSRMLLGGMPADGQYDALIKKFAKEGVERERLSFHKRCGKADYFALHRQVDICLDTFPYNGGTTTFNALWMGVPTLTLAGGTVPARQGATILGHVGLNAFVAQNAEDFIRKGLSWAGHPDSLAGVRSQLRERVKQSAIGRPEAVAASLECALRMMWQRWCAGLPAESFDVGPDVFGKTRQESD